MARNLTSVTLTAPSSNPSIDEGQSFTVTCTGGYSGGGGITSQGMRCTFSTDNVVFSNITGSGNLSTANTNPVTGKTTTSAESWTVTGNTAGTYYVRVEGDRPEGGSYDYFSSSQEVTVSGATIPGTDLPTFKLNYDLEGQGVGFINSNDNKIIIRSEAPEVTIADSGIERPLIGSLTLAGAAPIAVGPVFPGTASLTFATTRPSFPEIVLPGAGSMSFASVKVLLGSIIDVPIRNITLTEYSPERPTGLKLQSDAPTTVIAEVELPTTDSLSFAGSIPDVFSSSANLITRVPPTKPVSLAGQAPLAIIANVVLPGSDSLIIDEKIPLSDPVAYPGRRTLGIVGRTPDVIGDGGVIVIIEGPFNFGTFIRNTNATTDVPVNYQIDDRTGFKVKVKDTLMREYTGHLVRPDHLDKRSEQEFLRSKSDGGKGPQRPEPVGNEDFIEDSYPNGVSTDDL